MTALAEPCTRPVVVVGDVGLDVIARPRGPVNLASGTPSNVHLAPGGAGANSASWLAWAGMPVTLLARIGDDEAGRAARRELESRHVRCAFATDRVRPTCVVVVLLDASGDRTMFPDRGANEGFGVEDVDLPGLGMEPVPVPHLHLSGYVLFDEGSRAGGLSALRQARALGWTTSVDPQAAALIEAVGARTFLEWVDGTDLLLPNERELAALGGLRAVLAHVREVVTTYGPHGARWVGDGFEDTARAPHVDHVDATGAGDAFNAGLLSVWLSGRDRFAALRAGIEAGSTACLRLGARPS
ncbi:MAG TPA: PfkB family carbohydrate kinase [Intrasporangium sp.]|uniref:carbohydrate kinase family protein n=1 Tax=Intrasporangium sp. TaxID=1925024 RepID=UPI002D781729|nr:PfkB family carbohydrate kinase [Intrasporangium sp.]HET7399815.1 PfkB family carbohydrate kinase [Intrasporangium sp.]